MQLNEIMRQDVLTLSPESTLQEAAALFVERNISGAPVVDETGAVVGILSEGDLMKQKRNVSKPMFLTILDAAFPINYREINKELEALTATSITQLMSKNVVTLHAYDTIEDAATLMLDKEINRIPIMDDNSGLIGIVTRQDIIRAAYLPQSIAVEHAETDATTEDI